MVRKTSVKLLLSVDRIAIVLTHGELLKIITAGQKKVMCDLQPVLFAERTTTIRSLALFLWAGP
jgi:hypothetical protein